MTKEKSNNENHRESLNFIEQIVEEQLANGEIQEEIHTRFPPEPNGYLHIGHAKALSISFGIAKKYGGKTNLRFDDTNPVTEDTEYVEAIQKDIKWLGFDWEDRLYFSSDYFPKLYEFAIFLIKKSKAYVDDSTADEIAEMKGTPTQAGVDSPFRNRTVEENLKLFQDMNEGKYKDGEKVLRAKIDMAAPNMLMRDPIIYRIKHAHHHRTGDEWCIYPMYDFAHGQSDAIEEITHSLCSLEFQHHRPLYDWFIEQLEIYPSKQYEFARLNLSNTVMSKRKLLKMVNNGMVSGWDDPRMPTLSGMRRRGYSPAAILNFVEKAGVTKRENLIDIGLLEFCVREDLNKKADRALAVLDPIRLIITNYPKGKTEQLTGINNPEDETRGSRQIPFSSNLLIEKSDFMIDPPKKYFRLAPGRIVRLKHAFIIHCEGYRLDDETGEVIEVYASYYPESRSGQDKSGIKAKGTLHWVSEKDALKGEVRLYDRLFTDETPDGHVDKSFEDFYNKDSLQIKTEVYFEPSIKNAEVEQPFQFMRLGYFTKDKDSTEDKMIFNRTVTLKDSWAKMKK